MQAIIEALKTMPSCSGVYRMLSEVGEVLYVGKAKNLKKRVTNYTDLSKLSRRIGIMVTNTAKMEIIVTSDEKEALLLECDLIKNLKPKYNILLKDDKTFPHIFIPINEDFPVIKKVRGVKKQKGFYFGPFTDVFSLNKTIAFIEKMFLLRTCKDSVFKNRSRPCLLHQINRCSAPCVGLIDRKEYMAKVEKAILFLNGKDKSLKADLKAEMLKASSEQNYEKALAYRDKIRFLENTINSATNMYQGVMNADIISYFVKENTMLIEVFFVRGEKSCGNYSFEIKDENLNEAEALSEFISRFYEDKQAPKELIVASEFSDQELIAKAYGFKVTIPQRGGKKELIEMASENAKTALLRNLIHENKTTKALTDLKQILGLDNLDRIETYDNSHLSGTNPVGACVCFLNGKFDKNNYRRYAIKSGFEQSDYFMMIEVLKRRFSGADKDIIPNLILIDGGSPQILAVNKVEAELGLDLNFLFIAKGEKRNDGLEHFYKKDGSEVEIPLNSEARFLLQRLRDEAHRFAIGYQRFKRKEVFKEK
ncbi:MAG: UvrABC system protein C [Alphaproteobacteria bacterium ADurb.Bin438]|nr:MAG: UvrABC system protein C [Alphaproteobacteria bacterium ADurb.Bin438]